jgi:hypothetical protein
MREVWTTTSWGEACGPKPTSGGGAPGGMVTIAQQGGELSISGAGRTWSTTQCWEALPGLRRVSHSGGQRGWASRCTSAPGDPRRATIDTVTSATDDTIVFQETGAYEFSIADTVCRATVGRSRSFKLVQRAGEPPAAVAPSASASAQPSAQPSASAPPPSTPSTKPSAQASCAEPGEPVRLEVRPVEKLLRPGEAFSLGVVARDRAGCVTPAEPTLRLPPEASSQGVSSTGLRIVASPSASEGALSIVVEAAGRSVSVRVEVVRSERYAELVAERGLSEAGEDDRVVVATIEASLGGGVTRAEDAARQRKLVFVLIVAALALPIAVAGLVRFLRSKRRPEVEGPPPSVRAELASNVELFEAPGSLRAMECGRCGRIYPPSAAGFCEDDGSPLRPLAKPSDEAPASLVVEPAPASLRPASTRAPGAALICPSCGKRYADGAAFCGEDGSRLAPMH